MATILVADDRPSNRQFLSALLGYAGHRVLEAGDGAQALEMLRTSAADLLVTDILMPKMDGYELVQHMRIDPRLAAVPVIFWTATYSASDAQRLASSAGVGKVLPKPCEPEVMLAAIGHALGDGRPPAASAPAAAKPHERSAIDDSLGLRLKDLEGVKLKFDELARRSAATRAERDRVRELSREFSANVARLQRLSARLSALIEVGMEMTSERDPGRLVQIFFAAVCDIVPAKIAAAGVLDEQETGLRYVVAKGVDPAILHASAGKSGSGFLAALLAGHKPMRARSARGADAAGLPAGHPPVGSFLGVPIRSPDRVYGWLYLAERKGGREFGEEDERLALIMASKLALLYEHALLYDAIQRHAATLQIEVGERKRAEAALRESEAGLRRAQTLARLGHVITRPDGTFENWSDTLPLLAGLEPAAMPRTTRDWLNLVHPEDREVFRRTAIEAGTGGARRDLDYRLLRAQGEVAHIRQVMEPVQETEDSHGRKRWFNTLQDVSQQRQAEEARRKAELEFRSIFENAVEGIFRTTRAGRVLTANAAAAQMLGYASSADAVADLTDIGRQLYVDTADRDKLYAVLAADGFVRGFETRFRRKDGNTIWVSVSARILQEPGEEPTLLGMIQDVTVRKTQQERIVRLTRVHAVLSGINTLIVRVRGRDELFREACRIAVQEGQFRLAWIGMVDAKARCVAVAAWAGDGEGFIERMPLGLDEAGAAQRGLAGQAVAERRPMISEDMTRDPRIGLRDEAARRGFRALAILPLLVSGEARGVIALYAAETGFFDDEEMKLLRELASDIAFALEHLEALGRAEYLAFHDPLTGLPNRSVLVDHLDILIRAARRERHLAGVAFFDIERFRLVNETLGRPAGDALLRLVAERFTTAMRAEDTLARVGADGFAVAVAGFHSVKEAAHYFTERLATAFAPAFAVDGQALRVALKAGVAVFPGDGADAETLCRNAEAALKKAKETGEPLPVLHAGDERARRRDADAGKPPAPRARGRTSSCCTTSPRWTLDDARARRRSRR